jgi:hypothetical protein
VFIEKLNRTYAAQQSVTQFIAMFALNLVTPKAAAKQELLFNKPANGLVGLRTERGI